MGYVNFVFVAVVILIKFLMMNIHNCLAIFLLPDDFQFHKLISSNSPLLPTLKSVSLFLSLSLSLPSGVTTAMMY